MSLTVPQLLVLLGAALLAVGLFAPRAPARVHVPSIAARARASVAAHGVSALSVRWPIALDARASELGEADRRALFESLLAIDEPWCEPIIAAALAEEPTLATLVPPVSAAADERRDAA